MLSLTLTAGDSLQIGDDICVVFHGAPTPDRMKIGVEAPKERNIKRIAAEKKKSKIVIVKSET